MRERAEAFFWDYCRCKLEQAGHAAAVPHLRRFLRPVLRDIDPPEPKIGAPAGPGLRRYQFDVCFRVSDATVELNAADGGLMGWQLAAHAEGSTDALPSDQALAAAAQAAPLPPGAVLASAGYEEMAGTRVFLARWEHQEDGIAVERDYVQVLVNGQTGRVFALQRHWHSIDYRETER